MQIEGSDADRGLFWGVILGLMWLNFLSVPVYLDEQVQNYLSTKGVGLSDLLNDLLKREIEMIPAVG